jgi:isovaleryl-CoA dehydrogenase
MIDFDFSLGEDIDLLRDTVRDFAHDRIAPRAAEIDASNQFPRDLWPLLGDMGLLGITVGEEFGGAGLGYLAHVVAMEEISRASAAVACPTARITTCASTSCGVGATTNRNRSFCPH